MIGNLRHARAGLSYLPFMKILAAALVGLAFAAPAAAAPKLTPAERAAITRSIDVFVNHAVTRHDPAAAYDVVAPELRPGMTRKSWAHDDLPAYPFPRAWDDPPVEHPLRDA